MKIDFKISVWESISFNEATAEQIAMIKAHVIDNKVTYMDEVIDFCEENDIPYTNEGQNSDTEEQLYPADNNDLNTLEICDDEQNVLWGNGDQDLYEE